VSIWTRIDWTRDTEFGKPLGTGRCGWWCPIEPYPNRTLPI